MTGARPTSPAAPRPGVRSGWLHDRPVDLTLIFGVTLVACAIGAGIGFYDGFFGPGTGSFFVFLLVRVLGYDFLNASAGAKLLNTASNLAAIALFAWKGHV